MIILIVLILLYITVDLIGDYITLRYLMALEEKIDGLGDEEKTEEREIYHGGKVREARGHERNPSN